MNWDLIKDQILSYRITVKAIFARFIYVLFNMIAIWRVAIILQTKNILFLTLLLIPQFVETGYTLITRHAVSFKWVNPSAFCFLLCGVPCIWLIEFKLLQDRMNEKLFFSWIEPRSVSTSKAFGLSENNWADGLEQFLVFVCILAKWIAPKGNLSDQELSQLLIIYITNGADTSDLLEIFDDEQVQPKDYVSIVFLVLVVWSWSMLQFVFEMTSTKKFPFIPSAVGDNEFDVLEDEAMIEKFVTTSVNEEGDSEEFHDARDYSEVEERVFFQEKCHSCFCFYNEIWGIAFMLFIQDAPYLILRLYIFLGYQVGSQNNLFFLCKNLFLMALHIYRIKIIYKIDKVLWTAFRAKVVERQEEFNLYNQNKKNKYKSAEAISATQLSESKV